MPKAKSNVVSLDQVRNDSKISTRMGFYPTYQFGDHDPILDQIDTLRADVGNPSFEKISGDCRVSVSTLRNWELRRVKRPQFATVKAVVKALGGELSVTYRGKIIR